MKKLLFALLLLALPVQAQEYTSRYFHYDQWYDAPPIFKILPTTIDGADTNGFAIGAGGALATTRGAYIQGLGDDYGGAGAGGGLTYEAGTGTLAKHYFKGAGVAGTTLDPATNTFTFASVATLGSDSATDAVKLIYLSDGTDKWQILPSTNRLDIVSGTADGADDQTLALNGGGSSTHSRGAYITLQGSDVGGADAGGGIILRPASGAAGSIQMYSATTAGVNSVVRVTVPVNADVDDADLLFGAASTTAPLFTIRAQTADGDDDGILRLSGGGGIGATRGAYIEIKGEDVGGVDAGGQIFYHAGAGGNHQFTDFDTTLHLLNLNAPNTNDVTLGLGKTNPTAPVFKLIGRTSDGDDDGALWLAGAGDAAATRGGNIRLYGNEAASAGDVVIDTGDSATSDMWINLKSSTSRMLIGNTGGTLWTYANDGPLAPTGVAVASLPATCTAGAIWKATDSDNCTSGGGNGALCVCVAAGNAWALLSNY